jgi:hypothetical protein
MSLPTSRPQSPVPDSPSEDVASITAEEWMLVRLREQLYAGHWEEMQQDLESRLGGQPYIFKLANRIQDDLARIDRLRKIEAESHCDLKSYLPQTV